MQTVATPATQLDTSAVRERVFEVIRTLLGELGSQGALPMLHLSSQLDRELGLGSLERVDLLTRLENAFGLRVPDSVASEANTCCGLWQQRRSSTATPSALACLPPRRLSRCFATALRTTRTKRICWLAKMVRTERKTFH